MQIDLPKKFIANTRYEVDFVSRVLTTMFRDTKVHVVGNNGFFVCMLYDSELDEPFNSQFIEQLKQEFKLED